MIDNPLNNNPLRSDRIYTPPDDRVFKKFTDLVYLHTGNKLAKNKKTLLTARLNKRVRHLGIDSYQKYLDYLKMPGNDDEIHRLIDALTTNETHFFREPKHFDFLAKHANSRGHKTLRVWSAACSSGQEPYSIAMLLEDSGCKNWKLSASDINQNVLKKARNGRYPMELTKEIPTELLRTFCLKGTGPEAGFFRIQRALRDKIHFIELNLNTALPQIGPFDIVFLRNVLIYFSPEDTEKIVKRISKKIAHGGYLLVGHSESLRNKCGDLTCVAPTIYQKT